MDPVQLLHRGPEGLDPRTVNEEGRIEDHQLRGGIVPANVDGVRLEHASNVIRLLLALGFQRLGGPFAEMEPGLVGRCRAVPGQAVTQGAQVTVGGDGFGEDGLQVRPGRLQPELDTPGHPVEQPSSSDQRSSRKFSTTHCGLGSTVPSRVGRISVVRITPSMTAWCPRTFLRDTS